MSSRRKRGRDNAADDDDDESLASGGNSHADADSDVPVARKSMPSRSTRGKRMNKLLDAEEEEADEVFWGQEAWAEVSEDDDIVGLEEYDTDERVDSEDSDISGDEADEADDVDAEAALQSQIKRNRAQRSKRTGVYQDPALRRKQQQQQQRGTDKAKSTTPASASANDGIATSPSRATRAARASSSSAATGPKPKRSLRASTKTKTEVANEMRTVEEATRKKRQQQRKRKQQAPAASVKLTQRQLLEAAARTEIENKRSLKAMLMFQAECKRQSSTRVKHTGPRVRFLSRRGLGSLVTFTGVDQVPAVIRASAVAYPEQQVCAVTGLPARYRDPRTGVPYATLEAFKAIRLRSNHSSSNNASSSSSSLSKPPPVVVPRTQQPPKRQKLQQQRQQQQQTLATATSAAAAVAAPVVTAPEAVVTDKSAAAVVAST